MGFIYTRVHVGAFAIVTPRYWMCNLVTIVWRTLNSALFGVTEETIAD